MHRVVTFTGCEESRDVCHLIVVDPQSAHRIVDCWEDLHRYFTRVVPYEFLVDFEDPTKFDVEFFRIFVRQVEVDHVLAVDAEFLVNTYIEDLTCRDVTRYEVSVCWIFLFEEVPWLPVFVCPDTSTFPTSRFTHETKFVVPRNRSRVNLDELPVRVDSTLAVNRCRCLSCVDDRVCRLTEDDPWATCSQDHRVRWERFNFHRAQILTDRTAADPFFIDDGTKEFPSFIFLDETLCFVTTNLLIKCVKKLLSCCRSSVCRTVVKRSTETTEV